MFNFMRNLLWGLTLVAVTVAAGALAIVWYGQHPENRMQYHQDYRLALIVGLAFFFVGVMTGTQKNLNLALAIAIAYALVIVTPRIIHLVLERGSQQSSAYELNSNWADISRWAEMTLLVSFVLFFVLAVLHLYASRYAPRKRLQVSCQAPSAKDSVNKADHAADSISPWNASEATASS